MSGNVGFIDTHYFFPKSKWILHDAVQNGLNTTYVVMTNNKGSSYLLIQLVCTVLIT